MSIIVYLNVVRRLRLQRDSKKFYITQHQQERVPRRGSLINLKLLYKSLEEPDMQQVYARKMLIEQS